MIIEDIIEIEDSLVYTGDLLVGEDAPAGIYMMCVPKGKSGSIYSRKCKKYFEPINIMAVESVQFIDGDKIHIEGGFAFRDNSMHYTKSALDKIRSLKSFLDKYNSELYHTTPPSQDDDVIMLPINGWLNLTNLSTLYYLREYSVAKQQLTFYDCIQWIVPVKAVDTHLFPLLVGEITMTSDYPIIKGALNHSETWDFLCSNNPYYWFRKRIWNVNYLLRDIVFRQCDIIELLTEYESWVKDYQKVLKKNVQQDKSVPYIKWVAERTLYDIARLIYPDSIFQYAPDYLHGQSFDIYIPSLHCAIEYQGEQHYKAEDFLGGEEGLEIRKLGDSIKRQYCKEKHITLIEWNYKEKISCGLFMQMINKKCGQKLSEKILQERLNDTCPKTVAEILYYNPRTTYKRGTEKSKSDTTYVFRKYTLDGVYVSEYTKVEEAAISVDIGSFNINRVISGVRKQAGGFQWRKEIAQSPIHDIEPLKKSNGKQKRIYRVDGNGEILEEYESVAAASRAIGVNPKSIREAASGHQNMAGGYYWIYDD